MDQPFAAAFTAFADAWPRAIETEIGIPMCDWAWERTSFFDYLFCLSLQITGRNIIFDKQIAEEIVLYK